MNSAQLNELLTKRHVACRLPEDQLDLLGNITGTWNSCPYLMTIGLHGPIRVSSCPYSPTTTLRATLPDTKAPRKRFHLSCENVRGFRSSKTCGRQIYSALRCGSVLHTHQGKYFRQGRRLRRRSVLWPILSEEIDWIRQKGTAFGFRRRLGTNHRAGKKLEFRYPL